jgi:hypothetical protein
MGTATSPPGIVLPRQQRGTSKVCELYRVQELGRDLPSPELRVIAARRVMTKAHSSGSEEQMFGAKRQVPREGKATKKQRSFPAARRNFVRWPS